MNRSSCAYALVLAVSLVGCPSDPGPGPVDGGGGGDAPAGDAPRMDAPGTDAPLVMVDGGGTDAPVGTDAPIVGTDAPAVGTDAPVTAMVCGDGVRSGTEQCDDGNTTAGDGCDGSCNVEPSPTCGDGRVDRASGEECDDGGTANGDGCDMRCRVEIPATCGDGTLDIALGEECDDGNVMVGDGCSGSCQLEAVGAMCGDGGIDPPEACDDGNTAGGDACNATCNLANTSSLFAGMPGIAGRTDGIGTVARFTSLGVLAVDDRYLWMAEAPGAGGTPPGVLRRIEIATADVVTVANIAAAGGGIATNGTGTVWVAAGNTIQSIDVSGTPPFAVTTIHTGVAATTAANFVDGAPGVASFGDVRGLTWYAGFLWIVDTAAAVIRRMDPATGNVATVAGSAYMTPAAGVDGVGMAARFTSPRYIVSDNSGMLYISDTNGAAIRAMNAGTFAVTTLAGLPGTAGYVDGVGAVVRIHRPRAITSDGTSVYFAEFNRHTIRQTVVATGATSTVVGTPGPTGSYAEGVGMAAGLNGPWGLVFHYPTRSLFFSDGSNTIRRIQ